MQAIQGLTFMEMHQVRYFLAVSRTLNFTRAADECHVSQPSLTKAIQKLEKELGGLLFRRERGLTHLTDLGRLMLPHLEQTYAAAETARSLAEGLHSAWLVPLSLGIADNIFPADLAPMLSALHDSIPGLRLTLTCRDQGHLLDQAMAGELDILLLTEMGDIPERLHLRALWSEEARLLVPTHHALAKEMHVSPAALSGQSWVGRPGCSLEMSVLDQVRRKGGEIEARHVISCDIAQQQAVLAGLGIGLTWASTPLLPGLKSISLDQAPTRQVSLAHVAGRAFSKGAEAFIRLARARAWALPIAA